MGTTLEDCGHHKDYTYGRVMVMLAQTILSGRIV
jgi:hypothetical protein